MENKTTQAQPKTYRCKRNGEWIAWQYPVNGKRYEGFGRTEKQALANLSAKVERATCTCDGCELGH